MLNRCATQAPLKMFFFFKDFIYLFDTQRERQPAREGTQAGGVGEEEAGFQAEEGARCGARSQDPGIMP